VTSSSLPNTTIPWSICCPLGSGQGHTTTEISANSQLIAARPLQSASCLSVDSYPILVSDCNMPASGSLSSEGCRVAGLNSATSAAQRWRSRRSLPSRAVQDTLLRERSSGEARKFAASYPRSDLYSRFPCTLSTFIFHFNLLFHPSLPVPPALTTSAY
jgi:hypothetical protein